MLSQKARYALRAMIELARADTQVTAGELAERADAHGLQRSLIGSGCDCAQDFGFEFGKVGHCRKPHRNGFI